MTDQKHTEEPWKISFFQNDGETFERCFIETARGDGNGFGHDRIVGGDPDDSLAYYYNLCRIVECVNACAGIEDPATFRAQLEEVTWQRDELRQALLYAHKILDISVVSADHTEDRNHCFFKIEDALDRTAPKERCDRKIHIRKN